MTFLKSIFFLMILFVGHKGVGQVIEERGGVRFQSYEVPIEQRTSIHLTKNEYFFAKEKISTFFQLSFSRHSVFGHLFRMEVPNQTFFDFVFHPSLASDPYAYIKVILGGEEVLFQAPILKASLGHNKWDTLFFEVDATDKMIRLSIGGEEIEHSIENLALKAKRWNMFFGSNISSIPTVTDVAQFSIKDLKVSLEGNLKHHWLLNESTGNISVDHLNGKRLDAHQPTWLAPRHYFWEKQIVFQGARFPGIAFNKEESKLLFIGEDKMVTFDSEVNEKEEINFEHSPFDSSEGIRAFYFNKQLLGYDVRLGAISNYSQTKQSWSNTPPLKVSNLNFQHHNIIADSVTNSIYRLFGYGFYTFKNSFYQYDSLSHQWVSKELKGDFLPPRYLAGIGHWKGTKYLIFGGRGNPKGLQELTIKNYYDLYVLDVATLEVKKLWEMEKPQKGFVPVRSLIVDRLSGKFYTLVFNPEIEFTKLSLRQFSIEKPEVEIVSDTIPFQFRDVKSCANVFIDRQSKRLLAYTRYAQEDSSSIAIYQLNFPPGIPKLQPVVRASFMNDWRAFIILFFWGIVLLSIICFAIYKMIKVAQASPEIDLDHSPEKFPALQPDIKKNYMQLFGKFQLWGRDGNEIGKQLTPKLRQIFLMMVINQFYYNKGMSSVKLTENVWPMISSEKSNNSRSIAFNRIRSVLKQLDGISIIFENNAWNIQVEEPFYGDFLEFCQLKKRLEKDKDDKRTMGLWLDLLHNGFSFPEQKNEWLESKQSFIVSDTIGLLLDFYQTNSQSLKVSDKVRIADIILHIDLLDDQAFRIKLHALSQLGSHAKLHACYSNFVKHYEELYQEKYPTKIEVLLQFDPLEQIVIS